MPPLEHVDEFYSGRHLDASERWPDGLWPLVLVAATIASQFTTKEGDLWKDSNSLNCW